MPTPGETLPITTQEQIIDKAKDQTIDSKDALGVSDFLNKNPDNVDKLINNTMFNKAVIIWTAEFTAAAKKLVYPEEYTKAKATETHYKNILNFIIKQESTNKDQKGQCEGLIRMLEDTNNILDAKLNDNEFMTKWPKIKEIIPSLFVNPTLDAPMCTIIGDIIGKPYTKLDDIRMLDVYTLSDTQKASLAYQLVLVLPFTQQEATLNKTTVAKMNALQKTQITKENILAFKMLQYNVLKWRNDQTLTVFESLFKTWSTIPLMPSTYSIASGDGSGTAWYGWVENLGRWAFNYGKEISGTNNGITFGLEDKDMNIVISPKGEDKLKNNPNSGWSLQLKMIDPKTNTTYNINGLYKDGVLKMATNSSLKGVTLSNNTIQISKTYKDREISMNTTSAAYEPGNYDEVNFDVSIDNGYINNKVSMAAVKEWASVANDFNLWDYELDADQKSEIAKTFSALTHFATRTKKMDIPLNITSQADNNKFAEPIKFKTDTDAYINAFTKNNAKYKKILDVVNKFTVSDTDITTFKKVVKNDPDQIAAQKILIKARFISAIEQLIKTPGLADQIENGKFTINAGKENKGKRGVDISIGSFSYKKE